MAKVRIEWIPAADVRVRTHIQRGLARAGMHLEGVIIGKISIGQPVRRTPGGYLIGLNPSKPGEPPHVLHGRLRQSIKWAITKIGTKFSLKIGTNMEYGPRLEFGFVGRDSLGRNYSQAPRPFLRPSIREEFKKLGQMIAKG